MPALRSTRGKSTGAKQKAQPAPTSDEGSDSEDAYDNVRRSPRLHRASQREKETWEKFAPVINSLILDPEKWERSVIKLAQYLAIETILIFGDKVEWIEGHGYSWEGQKYIPKEKREQKIEEARDQLEDEVELDDYEKDYLKKRDLNMKWIL